MWLFKELDFLQIFPAGLTNKSNKWLWLWSTLMRLECVTRMQLSCASSKGGSVEKPTDPRDEQKTLEIQCKLSYQASATRDTFQQQCTWKEKFRMVVIIWCSNWMFSWCFLDSWMLWAHVFVKSWCQCHISPMNFGCFKICHASRTTIERSLSAYHSRRNPGQTSQKRGSQPLQCSNSLKSLAIKFQPKNSLKGTFRQVSYQRSKGLNGQTWPISVVKTGQDTSSRTRRQSSCNRRSTSAWWELVGAGTWPCETIIMTLWTREVRGYKHLWKTMKIQGRKL